MPTAIIFDVDGTLVDSVDLHAKAWQEAFAAFDYHFEFAVIRSQIGKGGDQLLPVFLSREQRDKDGAAIDGRRAELFKTRYLGEVAAFPSVRALFQHLNRNGKRIALASSSKKQELGVYARVARIDDLVDAHTTSEDADQSKPEPDIFQAALQRLDGIDPGDAVVVGDTPYDAEAAAKAGIPTIGVLCGGFAEADLRAAGCVEIYRDPADLLARYDTSWIARKGASSRD